MIKKYTLIGADGKPFDSDVPGTLGGYRLAKIYGTFDCHSALRAIEKGGYTKHRVFFLDESSAVAAGYRPCAKCMPDQYEKWKAQQSNRSSP
jgi:hypothetical protein